LPDGRVATMFLAVCTVPCGAGPRWMPAHGDVRGPQAPLRSWDSVFKDRGEYRSLRGPIRLVDRPRLVNGPSGSRERWVVAGCRSHPREVRLACHSARCRPLRWGYCLNVQPSSADSSLKPRRRGGRLYGRSPPRWQAFSG